MFLIMLLYGTFLPVLLHLYLEEMRISCTVLTIVRGFLFFCVDEAVRDISVPAPGLGTEQWAEYTPKL